MLKYYPQTIKEYEERIAGYENDVALAEQHKPQGEDKFCPMTLKGVTYTEKADAGEMLLAICKDYRHLLHYYHLQEQTARRIYQSIRCGLL